MSLESGGDPLPASVSPRYSRLMKHQEPPKDERADLWTFGWFALASAATIALGSAGLALDGAGPGSWLPNPAAWVVGLAIAGAIIAAGRPETVAKGAVALTFLALTATLFSPPQSGVQRWIDAGPLHINMAALLLPVTLVALARLNLPSPLFLAAVAVIGLILVAQPDASQATAFLLAAGFLLLRSRMTTAMRLAGAVGMFGLAVAAWLRPDPLAPVPQVEGIFSLLAEVSPALAGLAAVALAITCLIPLRRAPKADGGTAEAAKALVLYFSATAILPLAGAFPVPLVGLGMSFPVGYLMGVALLCALGPRAAES